MAVKLPIRYGGAVTGIRELYAVIKSAVKSTFSGNWQIAEESEKFVQEACEFLGVKHGLICNSGSSAGMLALNALELPKGSHVIIPAVTFPTIFNIIVQSGLKPMVVDCEVGTYNLDLEQVESALKAHKTIKAIIAVHAVGNPVDMPKLMEIAKTYDVKVIEDNCDGWGGSIDGKKLGTFGDVSFTSFHAAHIVSMGVGGGVFTNDENIARNAGMYRDWGRQANLSYRKNEDFPKLPKDQNPRFIYEKLGFNFNLLELQPAMGRVQLRKTESIKAKRLENFNKLYQALSKHSELILPRWNGEPCWFSFPLSIKRNREEMIDWLEKHQIETRSMFAGNILKHPAYEGMQIDQFGDLKNSNWILEHSFWVSCHPRLSKADMKYLIDTFDAFFA